jgi:hypothetical protein
MCNAIKIFVKNKKKIKKHDIILFKNYVFYVSL